MHRTVVALLVVLAVFLVCTPILLSPAIAQSTSTQPAVSAAVNYLVENYNSTVGLIPEVPGGNTYWLYSDNFLAALALERYDRAYPGNSTVASVATNIESNLSKYSADVPNALNQYMVLNSSIAAFELSNNYFVQSWEGATISTTINNGTGSLTPSLYADISFLEAIYYSKTGQTKSADDNYQVGSEMFDGKGLTDSVFQSESQQGQYQTFKLALYIYASKALGNSVPQSAEDGMLIMQDASGGFRTGYYANFSNDMTNTNVETTSLAILALLPTPPPPTPPPSTNTPTPTPTPTNTSTPTDTPPPPPPKECLFVAVITIALTTAAVIAVTVFYKKKKPR